MIRVYDVIRRSTCIRERLFTLPRERDTVCGIANCVSLFECVCFMLVFFMMAHAECNYPPSPAE